MAYCQVNFFSKELESYLDVIVLYPTPHNGDMLSMEYEEVYPFPRKTPKTLYLLHGALDDYTSWLRGSGVERYAEEHQICVVMPSGQNSFYADRKNGLKYYTFLTKELPLMAESIFGVSDKREDRFIAGLSMGGYGALRAALKESDKYAAVGSFSGALDLVDTLDLMKTVNMKSVDSEGMFGPREKIPGSDYDLLKLAENYKADGTPMDIYFACGTEDTLVYASNEKLKKCLEALQIPFKYEEGPGVHDWDFWDVYLRRFLNWLKEKGHIG